MTHLRALQGGAFGDACEKKGPRPEQQRSGANKKDCTRMMTATPETNNPKPTLGDQVVAAAVAAGHVFERQGPAIVSCTCGWMGPISAYPHCDRCTADKGRGTHHARGIKHKGDCRNAGCERQALRQDRRGNFTPKGHYPAEFCGPCYAGVVGVPEDTDFYGMAA